MSDDHVVATGSLAAFPHQAEITVLLRQQSSATQRRASSQHSRASLGIMKRIWRPGGKVEMTRLKNYMGQIRAEALTEPLQPAWATEIARTVV